MSPSLSEESHERGRRGVIHAKHFLWQVLGSAIDLPFNAYDHRSKLTFDDPTPEGLTQFAFDLGGVLKKADPARVGGATTVEVLVEVKAAQSGDGLLDEYREFLRRAAVASAVERHRDSWFIFVAKVPFGSTYGARLCNGDLLKECRAGWSENLAAAARDLNERVSLLIATDSFRRLIDHWGRDE